MELIHIKRDSEIGIQDAVNLELAKNKDARLMSITFNGSEYVAFIMKDTSKEEAAQSYASRQHCEDCKYWQGEDGVLVGYCTQMLCNKRRDKKASTCKYFSDTI